MQHTHATTVSTNFKSLYMYVQLQQNYGYATLLIFPFWNLLRLIWSCSVVRTAHTQHKINGVAHGGCGEVPLEPCWDCLPSDAEALYGSHEDVPRRSPLRNKVVLLPVGSDCFQQRNTISQRRRHKIGASPPINRPNRFHHQQ